MTAASGSLQTGDVVVTLPKDLAQRLNDFTSQWSGCTGFGKMKRGSYDAACLQANAETLITNAMPGRLFDNFFFMEAAVLRIGNLAAADYVNAMNNAINFAITLAGQLRVDRPSAARMGAFCFALVFVKFVKRLIFSEEVILQAKEVAAITTVPTKTSSASCRSDAPKTNGDNPLCCQDEDCLGDSKSKTCDTVSAFDQTLTLGMHANALCRGITPAVHA